jgi:hypothetical protein
VFVLNDGGLRDLPQLVERGVGQIEPTVADRQPRSMLQGAHLLPCQGETPTRRMSLFCDFCDRRV